jgi:high-affinity Fe2+/Pb2+ permease
LLLTLRKITAKSKEIFYACVKEAGKNVVHLRLGGSNAS